MSRIFSTIAIIGKYANPDVAATITALVEFLASRPVRVTIDVGTANANNLKGLETLTRKEIGEQCDLVITLGGDGTMLNAARSLAQYNVALVGINMGRLGFLTDIRLDRYQEKIGEILDGKYTEEERLLLQTSVLRYGEEISRNMALNDVVVHKWEEARMLEINTYIDGGFVNHQRSDGVIISTPTGSTAYALSGGGPILHPTMHCVVMVPICPHTLTQRPLVVSGDSVIDITISEEGHGSAQVTCDGQITLSVTAGDRIRIERLKRGITLIHPLDYDYYEILRAKLRWG